LTRRIVVPFSAALAAALALFIVGLGVTAPAAQAAVCGQYPNQAAAQFAGDTLDADHDGIYCEALPCPCSTAPPGTLPTAPVLAAPTAPAAPVATAPPASSPPSATPSAAVRIRARVLRVIDGDTLSVRTSTGRTLTVRLVGIDSPETKKPGTPVECGGRQATAAMKRLVLNHRGRGLSVTLTTDPTQDRVDRYGRTLAYVNLAASNLDVAKRLVRAGRAAVYVFDQPFSRLISFEAAQEAAKSAGLGVWRTCGGDFHRAP
jgi:micrococcal nuclease